MSRALRAVDPAPTQTPRSDEITLDDPRPQPLVPPGIYTAVLVYYETHVTFRQPRVYLHFRVVNGAHQGTMLFRAYAVAELTSNPGRGGAFKVNRKSDLFMKMVEFEGIKVRPQRFSLLPWKRQVFKVAVRTVKTDYKQRPLPEFLQYSVVHDLLRKETGS